MTSNQIAYENAQTNKRNAAANERNAASNERNASSNERNARTNEGNLRETKRYNKIKGATDIANSIFGNVRNAASGINSIIGLNHAEWYNRNKKLVDDVARISFHVPYGAVSSFFGTTGYAKQAAAGIMRINYIRTPGFTGSGSVPNTNNAVNIAAQSLYSFVRYKNSGASNYEPADLMMYILALDELYSLLAFGVRGYRVSLNASASNWYQPKALLNACGCDDTWLENPAQVRSRLNIAMQRAAAFNVPNIFHFFTRHLWLGSNVFQDSKLTRGQYYVFTSTVYGVYKPESAYIDYGFLGGASNAETNVSTEDYFEALDDVISGLLLDEDIGIISGDLLKAYGSDNMYRMEMLDDFLPLQVQNSDELMSQISGATVMGSVRLETMRISQVPGKGITQGLLTGTTYSGICFNVSGTPSTGKAYDRTVGRDEVLVNMLRDEVTSDDVMVATRLAVTYDLGCIPGTDSSVMVKIPTAYGTELVSTIVTYRLKQTSTGAEVTIVTTATTGECYGSNAATINSIVANWATDAWEFDWAPGLAIRTATSSTSSNAITVLQLGYYGDVSNYAIVSASSLVNMHTVAVQSMFDIPQLSGAKAGK